MGYEEKKQRSGWHSTKLHLALITMATLTAVFVARGIADQYFGEYCFALITAAGIYSSARVAESFAQRRAVATGGLAPPAPGPEESRPA